MSREFYDKLVKAATPHAIVNAHGAAAHGCNESGYGASELAVAAKNIWGVKAVGGRTKFWDGATVEMSTWEEVAGTVVPVVAAFRKYASLSDAVGDYADIISRVYPFSVKYAHNAAAFLAGLFVMGPSRWATDSLAFYKAMSILEQMGGLKVSPSGPLVSLGEFGALVNNSPSVAGGMAEIGAALRRKPHVRGPHAASKTLRATGDWKLDVREVSK